VSQLTKPKNSNPHILITINSLCISGEKILMEQEDEQTLTQLGLTVSQGRVYLALAKLGKANARTLWKSSKVARQDIYRILTELREIGLLEKIIGTPTEFKAVPIEEGVSILVERKTKEIFSLQKNANKLIQKFKENNPKITLNEEDQYILIPEREPLTLRLKKTIGATQKSIDRISSQKAFARVLFALEEEFKKALRRGVKIRWIIGKPEAANSWPDSSLVHVLMKNPNFMLRTIPNTPHVRLGIYDQKEVFMATIPKRAGLDSPVLRSTDSSFAEIVEKFFDTMWSTAAEYKLNEH
jgi:sugar-specific transcriptional regulator TrmB